MHWLNITLVQVGCVVNNSYFAKSFRKTAMIRVLFVCTGNICRSPTAEGVFKKVVQEQKLDDMIFSDSAGTHGYHIDEAPDARAIAAARRRGVDIADLRARKVNSQDFDAFDIIVALDDSHARTLRRLAPKGGKAQIVRLLDYVESSHVSDVPDPYYGGMEDFEHALDLIESGIQALVAKLAGEKNAS